MRYEFSWTRADDTPAGFSVGAIADDEAKAIRFGLSKLSSIKALTAQRVDETRQNVTGTPT
jgi:hypothetical protein